MSAAEQEQLADEMELPTYAPPNDDIPEETDEDGTTTLNDGEASIASFAPPPRIAARFYRPSANRRRSSAASSRRNSISSTHSHSSTRSLRGGCQSNHVAQHLRRASIIESRQARLAARAAHAEQVRIRAALAKAAPRSSNIEERAQAAQKAREKHLAQVAAACAEEVRRAKKVAEDMKERREAEEKRNRIEMEERLAEAEKRRLLHNRNIRRRRGSSSPSKKPADLKPPLSSEDAASRIQAAWRVRQKRKDLKAYASLNLSIEDVRDTDFDRMTELVADEKVLLATGKVLELFKLVTDEDPNVKSSAPRIFLTAYMILGHPAAVFNSKDGDQEQGLISRAKELVISFEDTLSKTLPSERCTPDSTLLESLALAHSAYVTAFNDWKSRDASFLIETMVASFVNLDAIWQTVKDDKEGEVAEDYRQGIRENQVLLLARIKRLAGADRAAILIKKAIRESRRSRPRQRPIGDLRPRAAVEALPSPPAEDSAGSSAAAVAEQLPTTELPSQSKEADAFAKLFSRLPDNRTLVHELAINKEYQIEAKSEIRDALNQDICEAMRKAFEQGDGNVWTLAMAQNVRAKLLRTLKPGGSVYNLISETLDLDLVQQQCVQGVFSYERFFRFMADILPQLCAPFRDDDVKVLAAALQEPGNLDEMIGKLFKLLQFIDLLSLDYSNFLLAGAAPTLLKESAGYEQRMFEQDLEAGNITLAKTKHWWNDASVNLITESDRRDPLHRPTTQKIYARGLVDLAITTHVLQENELPETFSLDRERIERIRADSVRIATVGAILLTAKNLLKRDVRSQWKPEANRLLEATKSGFGNENEVLSTRLMSIVESGHPMPAATKAQLSGTIARLLQQAERGRLSDPVVKVLYGRLKTHVFNRLAASSSGERIRAASTASEGLATSGLPEFVTQVGDIVNVLTKMAEVDQKAHGRWYEQIAQELEGRSEDES